jgi:LysR family transcriptional regulator, regulator for genes of the gallate degradation pathway
MPALLPNLRHLLALREVVRTGSISAAARAVHLSQPAVTQAVSSLERAFVATLFERGSRGMTATAAGVAVAARVGRALEQLQEGIEETRRGARRSAADPLRAITTAQLQALVGVAEQGAFGRAARAGGVARTTVHRAARQLERVLGAMLFETTSHGVRPTRDAERLARRVRLAATEVEQARAEVELLGGREGGTTVIGAMPLARSVVVPAAVLEFASGRPRHRISILDGAYETLLEALQRGRADLLVGALRDAVPEDVRQEHLFDDPLAIIVRAGHPLARAGRRLTPESLAAFPWIAPRAGSPLRRHYEALFPPGAVPPAEAVECNSQVAARALLVASDRVMLLSALQVEHERAAGQLVALPHPRGDVRRQIGITVRRDWRPTAAQAELLECIRRNAPRQGEARPRPGSRHCIAVARPSR